MEVWKYEVSVVSLLCKLMRYMIQTIGQQIKWDFKTNGFLEIRDKNGNQIYYEGSNGAWAKREWDFQGNQIYFENSLGEIEDNRPKPCENKEIVIEGIKYKLTKV